MKLATIAMLALAVATPAMARSPVSLDPIFAGYGPQTPGCAVGVKAKDAPPTFAAYGSADLEHAVPITPETVFEAGSVSKQFTAAAVLILAAEGKLSLSDDIRKHLPQMPDYGRPITIDMLLSHTSGLRDWGEVMEIAGWPRTSRVYTPAEVLQIAARQTALNYAPGEAYSYTNTGFNLAAAIVQQVSGQTLAYFTRDRLFQPLGLTHTAWRDDFRRIVPGRSVAYRAVAGGFAQEMPFENTYGHGGLLTTVGDLLAWNEALTSGKLGPAFDAQMRQQAVLTGGRKIAYAHGLFVQSYRGAVEVAHSGSTAGYRAWLGRMPQSGLSVALLCNRGDANPTAIAHQVVDTWLARPAEPPAQPTSKAVLDKLPGVYLDERLGGLFRLTAEGGVLRVQNGAALSPIGPDRFDLAGNELTFAGDRVARKTPDGEVATYRRITPITPVAADLQALAGTYGSAEAGAVWLANVRDGKLVITPSDRPSAAMAAEPLERDAFHLNGNLIRVLRGADGRVSGLRVTGGRVYALDFRRTAAP